MNTRNIPDFDVAVSTPILDIHGVKQDIMEFVAIHEKKDYKLLGMKQVPSGVIRNGDEPFKGSDIFPVLSHKEAAQLGEELFRKLFGQDPKLLFTNWNDDQSHFLALFHSNEVDLGTANDYLEKLLASEKVNSPSHLLRDFEPIVAVSNNYAFGEELKFAVLIRHKKKEKMPQPNMEETKPSFIKYNFEINYEHMFALAKKEIKISEMISHYRSRNIMLENFKSKLGPALRESLTSKLANSLLNFNSIYTIMSNHHCNKLSLAAITFDLLNKNSAIARIETDVEHKNNLKDKVEKGLQFFKNPNITEHYNSILEYFFWDNTLITNSLVRYPSNYLQRFMEEKNSYKDAIKIVANRLEEGKLNVLERYQGQLVEKYQNDILPALGLKKILNNYP